MTTPHWIRDWTIISYYHWHNERMPKPRTPVTVQALAHAFGLTKGRVSQILTDWGEDRRRVPEFETIMVGCLLRGMIEKPIKDGKIMSLEDLADMVKSAEPD